jgi:hypothetical protein
MRTVLHDEAGGVDQRQDEVYAALHSSPKLQAYRLAFRNDGYQIYLLR